MSSLLVYIYNGKNNNKNPINWYKDNNHTFKQMDSLETVGHIFFWKPNLINCKLKYDIKNVNHSNKIILEPLVGLPTQRL